MNTENLIEEYYHALHAAILAGKTWPIENQLEHFEEDDDIESSVRQAVFAGLLARISENLAKGQYADAAEAPRIVAWLEGKQG